MKPQTETQSVSHAPGPWTIDDAGPASGNIIRFEIVGADKQRTKICDIEDSTMESSDRGKRRAAARDEANAQLVAAAPDLLAALKCIAEFSEAEGSPFALSAAKTARAAIAKATA